MRYMRVIALTTLVAGGLALALPATVFANTRTSGTEHFELLSTAISLSAPGSIIGTGVFAAGGIDYPRNKVDLAVFQNGAFSIDHSGVHVTFHFNPSTCVGRITGSGPYKIVRGYGVYANIRGAGTATVSGLFVTGRQKNGTCDQANILANQQVIHASGPVSL
jgi:hypothetical protein